jgi:hypothetical protein
MLLVRAQEYPGKVMPDHHIRIVTQVVEVAALEQQDQTKMAELDYSRR